VVPDDGQIAQMIGCEFCARHIPLLTEIPEEIKVACALPEWDHSDPRARGALRYTRTLTLDDGRDTQVYAELEEHFSYAEIVELVAFSCLTAGVDRMGKSVANEPHAGEVVPDGAMSITAEPGPPEGQLRGARTMEAGTPHTLTRRARVSTYRSSESRTSLTRGAYTARPRPTGRRG
jgi:hypothetical protein